MNREELRVVRETYFTEECRMSWQHSQYLLFEDKHNIIKWLRLAEERHAKTT